MEEASTFALVTSFVSLLGLLIAALNLKDQPKIKFVLVAGIAILVVCFVWYAAPRIRLKQIMADRERVSERTPSPEQTVQNEAKKIEEAHARKEEAERLADVYDAERKAAFAKIERDKAQEEADQELQHRQIQQAAKKAADDASLQNAVVGVWQCSDASKEFKSDGTLVVHFGFDARYKVVDKTHIELTSTLWQVKNTAALSLDGPTQMFSTPYYSCTRPKP